MDLSTLANSQMVGVVVGGLIATTSTVAVWIMGTKRDERLEARRVRLEAGLEALRAAHRLERVCIASLRANREARIRGGSDPSLRSDPVHDGWLEELQTFREQVHLANVLCAHAVGEMLETIADEAAEYMTHYGWGNSERPADLNFMTELDAHLKALSFAVATDSRVTIGTRNSRLAMEAAALARLRRIARSRAEDS